jgi:acid phosphatase class B
VYDQPTSQWKFDASAVATNESMDLTLNGVQTANHATFNIKQDPKDPMCSFFGATANGVYFDFDFSIWRASSYSYSGTARLAPDHELYLKDSDQASWNTLFQREALSLDCLNPLSLTAIFSDCMTTAGAQGSR